MFKVCKTCVKYSKKECPIHCSDLEAELEKEYDLPEEVKPEKFISRNVLLDANGEKTKADGTPIIGISIVSIEPQGMVMSKKDRKNLEELIVICDRKSRKPKKHIFLAFMKCDKENEIAKRLNCTPQNVQKYLARICKCLLLMNSKDPEEAHKVTPKKFKERLIWQSSNY